MSDPVILFVKPGAVNDADLARLSEVGVCVVRVDEPSEVKLMRAATEISAGEMLSCAARAIKHGNDTSTKAAFADFICRAIIAKDAPAPKLTLTAPDDDEPKATA